MRTPRDERACAAAPMPAISRAGDRVIFALLLALVILAPAPLASVPDWAWASGAAATGALLAAWKLNEQFAGGCRGLGTARLTLAGSLYAAAMLWALLQNSSLLPRPWQHPLWRDLDELFGAGGGGSVSIDPSRSAETIARMLTAAGIFWLAAQYCRAADRALRAVWAVSLSSLAYAAYGLGELFSGTETIWWLPKHAYVGDLTSTFVNRNSYATYAGLGWLCSLALLYRGYSQAVQNLGNGRERLRASVRYLERAGWPLLVAGLIQASALLLSHSRGGLASTLAGIAVLCLCLSLSARADRPIVRSFALSCAVLALVFYAAGGRGVDRRLAATDLARENRLEVFARTEDAIASQPVLGTGLGSFEEVFRFYRPAGLTDTFDHAHDDYLELALELGVPAALLFCGALAALSGAMLRGVRIRRRDNVYPALGIAATTLVAVHSTVDFSARIPAVAMVYALILGIGVAQSFPTLPAEGGKDGRD